MPQGRKFILALDQGTTSSRALLIDEQGKICGMQQQEFEQIFPRPGWVEHDAETIWSSQIQVARKVLTKLNGSDSLVGVGIANQRETTILWNRKTGKPLAHAIVWQDRRTAAYCENLIAQGHSALIQEKTGLIIDAYFSASKIHWLLENLQGAREQAERGELAAGTIDSWLIWNLTKGQVHATDFSNASRTMLFNIHQGSWDQELLNLFEIPRSLLPEVRSCSEIYGLIDTDMFGHKVPIAGVAGDQQAAMFGQLCLEPGSIKNTYGTGCFLMLNTGFKPLKSEHRLLTTIAWRFGQQTTYAAEGSVFIAGAAIQWLRDGLGLIGHAHEIEALAAKAPDNGGVYFVPAFTGLGAPYWDSFARGTIIGLTRGSRREHIARAALEAIAFQTKDLVDAMRLDAQLPLSELRVDGGGSANGLLMQFQADMLAADVVRPKCLESTALGAAFFAGLATGFFPHLESLQLLWQEESRYRPKMPESNRHKLYNSWQAAIKHTAGWIRDTTV